MGKDLCYANVTVPISTLLDQRHITVPLDYLGCEQSLLPKHISYVCNHVCYCLLAPSLPKGNGV
jgi:hypothetical protein